MFIPAAALVAHLRRNAAVAHHARVRDLIMKAS
jgi:hypothetical protein